MSDPQKVEAGQVEDTVIVTVNGKVKYNGPALEFKGLAWTEIAPTPDPRDAVIEAARKHVAEWNGHPCLRELHEALTALDAAKAASPK